jgi:anti-anti-sigma factor
MDLTIEETEGVSVVEARGRIDTVTSKVFSERLTGLIGAGATRVVIDLAQIAYISSAGFRSLLQAGKMIEAAQGRLALSGVTGEVRRLFEIAAFTELFVICPTRQEGIASVTGRAAA